MPGGQEVRRFPYQVLTHIEGTQMDERQIGALINQAIVTMLANQPNFFDFTSETNQTEWNIAHHLAVELHALFNGYDCDVDVAKPNLGRNRPDIIIHKRGGHRDNFLVVEVKRNVGDIWDDVQKIVAWWFEPRLLYRFGAVVAIDKSIDPPVVVPFANDNHAANR
jgi:hypothetical protein